MNNEIDHDLAERIGATHVSPNQPDATVWYYKIVMYGVFCWSASDSEWRNNSNSIYWLLKNLKPIPPRPKPKEPEYEYESIDFGDKHWHAARMICDGAELWCKAKDDRFYKLTTQSAAVKHSQKGKLYTRKEIKRDWRDVVIAHMNSGGYLIKKNNKIKHSMLIGGESVGRMYMQRLSESILKAEGEGL